MKNANTTETVVNSTQEAHAETVRRYRKWTFEARMDALLPEWEAFDVIAHELWRESEGGWSVNYSWHLARGCDREEAISHLRHRWSVFKANYMPKAAVSAIEDAACDDECPVVLEVNCTAFAELRKAVR